jgi:hypothetical protein
MVQVYNIEIEEVEKREIDELIDESFNRRLSAIITELAEIQTRIEYLKDYDIERMANNDIFQKAPHFMQWTLISAWHSLILSIARLFETRTNSNDIRNIPKFHEFIMNTWEQLYTKDFFRVLSKGDEIVKEKVELNTKDEIKTINENFFLDNRDLISEIVNFRDKKLAHITFKTTSVRFRLEDIDKLYRDTEHFINVYTKNYNNVYSTVSDYSMKDHREVFKLFKKKGVGKDE